MKKRAEERRRSSRTEEDTVANKQREVKCRQIEWSEIHLFDSMNAVSCSVFFRLGSQQVRLNTLANGIAPFPLLWMAPATPCKSYSLVWPLTKRKRYTSRATRHCLFPPMTVLIGGPRLQKEEPAGSICGNVVNRFLVSGWTTIIDNGCNCGPLCSSGDFVATSIHQHIALL